MYLSSWQTKKDKKKIQNIKGQQNKESIGQSEVIN
jgi:hypothetical protein